MSALYRPLSLGYFVTATQMEQDMLYLSKQSWLSYPRALLYSTDSPHHQLLHLWFILRLVPLEFRRGVSDPFSVQEETAHRWALTEHTGDPAMPKTQLLASITQGPVGKVRDDAWLCIAWVEVHRQWSRFIFLGQSGFRGWQVMPRLLKAKETSASMVRCSRASDSCVTWSSACLKFVQLGKQPCQLLWCLVRGFHCQDHPDKDLSLNLRPLFS